MNDTRIWSVLKPMHPAVLEDMPLDGTWLEPPFANDAAGRAVICNDGDFQFVVVNRKSGAVLYVCEDEETLMASSLATLPAIVTCTSAARLGYSKRPTRLRTRRASVRGYTWNRSVGLTRPRRTPATRSPLIFPSASATSTSRRTKACCRLSGPRAPAWTSTHPAKAGCVAHAG